MVEGEHDHQAEKEQAEREGRVVPFMGDKGPK